MKLINIVLPLILLSVVVQPGCGGASGGIASVGNSGGGIGGTGITSNGTIDGFGSIFVNGVEYETDDSEVSLNGAAASADQLRLGMVVTVRGTVNEDKKTGSASQVIFDSEVKGPVSAIDIVPGADTLRITVLGVSIIAERTATVFDNVTFDTLALDDLVEVSGFVENGALLRATRIEKKSDFVPGGSEVELKGAVSALTPNQFTLGVYVIDYSNADLSEIAGGVLNEGMQVEVHGTLDGTVVRAYKVEEEGKLSNGFGDRDEVSLQGAITQFIDKSSFVVDGVTVDATNATLQPANLSLVNGMIVEIEGPWNGAVVVARTVEARRGRVKLEAHVASVNIAERSLTLEYFAGAVTVAVSNTTLLKDDTGQANPLTLDDIVAGNFLQIEAIQIGDTLVASRIRRDSADDNVLQAPVESFTTGVDVTLLGITFATAGAIFESQDDTEIGAEAFFGQLQVGDLVRVEDKGPADGVADELEFEDSNALEGSEYSDDSDDECAENQLSAATDCESTDGSDDEGSDDEGSDDDGSDDDGSDDDGSDDGCATQDTQQDCATDDHGSDDECNDCESDDEEDQDPEDDA
ncbi:MAG: DUF5666 domain-containing protein [Halioglobus sp.]